MSEVETIAEVVAQQWPEPPRLLVAWSSPWQEFKTALRPALARSPDPLAGEAPIGMFPYRGMLSAWLLECLLLIAAIVLPERLSSLQPFVPPPHPKWDVIYYSGDELPQTADRGGAQAGKSGRAGGQQAHHRTQTIKVARGDRPGERIVDAPKLDLPHSNAAVANLLAYKPIPGPPPAEGLASQLVAPRLPMVSAVPPTPEVNANANHRQDVLAANVVAPAPEVAATNHNSQALTAAPIAPAPEVAHDARRSSSLPSAPVAPSPDVSHDSRRTSSLSASAVAPTPNASPDQMRPLTSLAPNVVGPAPREDPHDLASSRVTLSQTANVVAPPVSAPQRDLPSTAKLSLPAPAVVAPPPSQVSRDLNSWGSTRSGEIRSQPVPPPPSSSGGGAGASRSGTTTLASAVVPPPVDARALTGNGAGGGGGSSASSGNSASGSGSPSGAAANGGNGTPSSGRPGAPLSGWTAVPPPPSLGGGKALSGTGRGNKGTGAGGPLDVGSALAPPGNAGNAAGNGVVISSQPGTKVGLPSSTGGALAMSPTGSAKSGLGGSGGGTGIGRGNGSGSGFTGEGSGAGKEGAGRGSDPNARGGISPYPGPGGAGTGTSGSPAMPGVSVEGGTTTVTLPSFGPPGGEGPAAGPGRSSTNNHTGSGITIEATPRSGGVFAYYGVLKGDRNYSIYIETSIGMAVMQYADPASAAHPSTVELIAPEPMRKELPGGLRPTRVIIACILDRSGVLKNVKVLEPGAAETTSKILVALESWKFRPAFRGSEPVEVNAILGFGVDTR